MKIKCLFWLVVTEVFTTEMQIIQLRKKNTDISVGTYGSGTSPLLDLVNSSFLLILSLVSVTLITFLFCDPSLIPVIFYSFIMVPASCFHMPFQLSSFPTFISGINAHSSVFECLCTNDQNLCLPS